MKPPNSDANRPGSPSAGQLGKPATPGTDPAGKPGAPGNVEASAPKVGQDGVKTDALKTEAAKAEILKAETGKPDAAKPDAAKSDAGKPDAGKPDAAKPEPPKAEAFKADAPKSGAFGGGTPGGARPNASVTDGPIIDLKAKRLPDPVPPAKPTAPGAASGVAAGMAGKTADPKAQDPKPSDAKSSEPKPLDANPTSPGDAAAKPPGSTTPRISPAAAAAPVPAPRGPGFGSLATAGLLGGVIGAGLLFGVERSGLLHPGEDGRLDALDQRVSALQEEPGRDQGGDTRLAVAPSGPSTAQVGALEDRLKALEGKVDGAPKSAPVPDLTPKLAALQGDVEARTRANAEAAQALSQKVTALQQSLEARIQAATESVQAATQASEKVADAGKAQAAEAAKAVERQLQAQADRIAGLDKAVSERAETATLQAALRVVSADRIVTALNTGAPYADALAALRGLEPGDPARLTAVAAFADKGAPTARSLAAEFRPIAEKIAASRRAAQTRAVAETGDIGTKLMSMAESIVQVRRVESQGSGSAAQPAPDTTPKVQEALDRGAIKEAAEAFAALPEAARTEAGEFGIKLRSRAAAGDAAQGLLAEAFKGLPATGASR